jgi:hypothetical protein
MLIGPLTLKLLVVTLPPRPWIPAHGAPFELCQSVQPRPGHRSQINIYVEFVIEDLRDELLASLQKKGTSAMSERALIKPCLPSDSTSIQIELSWFGQCLRPARINATLLGLELFQSYLTYQVRSFSVCISLLDDIIAQIIKMVLNVGLVI